MLMYIILDWSTDIILWLIKNIGRTGYYSICYLFGGTKEPEKLDNLKELIEQKKDIQEIKKLLEELKKNN
jgi:hypothetical protein